MPPRPFFNNVDSTQSVVLGWPNFWWSKCHRDLEEYLVEIETETLCSGDDRNIVRTGTANRQRQKASIFVSLAIPKLLEMRQNCCPDKEDKT